MRRLRGSRHLLAALIAVMAVAGLGGGVAMAVTVGTAGELNYQRKTQPFNTPGGAKFTVDVPCPSNRHVTGGGSEPVIHDASVEVASAWPYDSGDAGRVPDDGWRITGWGNGQFTIVGYAICDN